jgi:ubiquinone/menaquinone biosynthesis C-methylase UbiE
MSTLVHEGSALAYRLQQQLLVTVCGVTQRIARRALLDEREEFTSTELHALRRRHGALLQRDLENVRAGVYPRSLLFGLPWQRYARLLPRLARDVPHMMERKKRGGWRDLPADVDVRRYPPYYRRTFHWQTDGYLSEHSAELYDVSVEFLFGGMADVMRRQCLVPLHAAAQASTRPLRILDVGCGTGRTLAQIAAAQPAAELAGVDLSPFYIERARAELPHAELVAGNAESLPFADASFDAVVSVFLFHELPRHARRTVWAEARRVLRPGGRFIVVDSVQRSDSQEIAYFVDRFSRDMHEPFYREYIEDDLAAGLRGEGFAIESVEPAYLAKVVTARTPQPGAATP